MIEPGTKRPRFAGDDLLKLYRLMRQSLIVLVLALAIWVILIWLSGDSDTGVVLGGYPNDELGRTVTIQVVDRSGNPKVKAPLYAGTPPSMPTLIALPGESSGGYLMVTVKEKGETVREDRGFYIDSTSETHYVFVGAKETVIDVSFSGNLEYWE